MRDFRTGGSRKRIGWGDPGVVPYGQYKSADGEILLSTFSEASWKRIVDAMSQGSGFFQHGHTYLGHPVACAAALAVQQVIERDGLLAKVRTDGDFLGQALRDALGQHPHVGDIRGRGFFWGVELVADRASKAPLDPAQKVHARLKKKAMDLGPVP